jgi:hypothetical protein
LRTELELLGDIDMIKERKGIHQNISNKEEKYGISYHRLTSALHSNRLVHNINLYLEQSPLRYLMLLTQVPDYK